MLRLPRSPCALLLAALMSVGCASRPVPRTQSVHHEPKPSHSTQAENDALLDGERLRLFVAAFLLEVEHHSPRANARLARGAEFRSTRSGKKVPLVFALERIAKRTDESQGLHYRFDLAALRSDFGLETTALNGEAPPRGTFRVPYRLYALGGRSKPSELTIGLTTESGRLAVLFLQNDAGDFH